MTEHGTRHSPAMRLTQLVTLLALFTLLWLATRLAPEYHGTTSLLGAIGFLVLAGTLASELCEVVGLPHLSGYIVAGVIAGPYVLHLFDHDTVGRLAVVDTLALAGGAELRLEQLRAGAKSLGWSMLLQGLVVLALCAAAFAALAPLIPF